MATKKKATDTVAKLEIVCTSNEEADVKIEGDLESLIAALASLMSYDDEENAFRQIMATAIQVVLFQDALNQKKATKKAITKKKAAPKKKK